MLVLKLAALLLSMLCLSSANKLEDLESRIQDRNHVKMLMNVFEAGLRHEIINFTETGHRSKIFNQFVDENGGRTDFVDQPPEKSFLTCTACRLYLASLLSDHRGGAPPSQLIDSAAQMCRIVTPFEAHVCHDIVEKNVESMLFIIDSRPALTATNMCNIVLQGDCGPLDNMFAFTVNVSPGQPINAPKSVHTPPLADDLRIVHLSDLHYDPHYLEGGLGNCVNPVCCRRNDGIPANPADRAGHWGDYRQCDTPWRGIEDALRRVRAMHPDADYIYHTGDIIDHGIWETTYDGNVQIMDRVYNLFREVFGNTPVYHVLGNHEAQPTNLFAPSVITRPSLSTQWLFDYSADIWQRHGWLSGNAVTTVRARGYYTVLLRPGFRLIGMNNIDCYIYNWWTMYSRTEIAENLQWLHTTLLAAEANHERVHILKHIPSGGGSCFKFWSREYRRIIDRFHMIIGAQFEGHSHRDEFEIFYDSPTAQHAVNVAWNGGSATAFGAVNPNYVLYRVDRTHYQVNDAESFIFSISEANLTPNQSPRWFRQYSFREAFGMTDLSPASLDRLAFDMSRNRNILRRFWEFKVKAADPFLQAGCNDDCLRSQVCRIVTTEHDEPRRCNQVLAVFGTVA